MKNLLSIVLAGMVGGLIVFAGTQYMKPDQVMVQETPAQAINANYNTPSILSNSGTVPTDFTFAAEKAMNAVVHISANESQVKAQQRQKQYDPFGFFFGDSYSPYDQFAPRRGSGSGVIISKDGYIVTNNHVVDFADEVLVTTNDNRKFTAEVIGTDPQTDLAVLKIDAFDLESLKYGDSDESKVGEWVLAVGNPFDLNSTVTAGIISAKGRDIDIIRGKNAMEAFIQTDAAVNPGNSGGALVNTRGELIGINTAIASRTGSYVGYSFAIPVNMMKRITEDIIKFGEFKRVSLGVMVVELDSDLSEELGLSVTQGVVVNDLVEGGSAQYAGILPNDVIVQINGRPVRNFPDLQEMIGRAKVGETINLTLLRRNQKKEVPVRLRNSG